MILHRIVLKKYGATAVGAFGGIGGVHGSGRWHKTGRQIVYTSHSLSLAALEMLVHIQRVDGLQAFVRWEIDVPDSMIVTHKGLPADWRTDEDFTQTVGNKWLESGSSVALRVPSAIIPQESNVLLNPLHPKFDMKWVGKGPLEFRFDPRLKV